MPDKKKLSSLETIKSGSHFLRGRIAEEVAGSSDSFDKDTVQLLKHHGIYQQDNRDARGKKDGAGKSRKSYMLMVRTRIPGGRVTARQMLAELDLCDEVGNSTLRITTRQGLQLHGVLKHNLKQAVRRINEVQLTTFAACGDVERNVMCCPAPYRADPVHDEMQAMAGRIAEHFKPRSQAYHEIWLTDPETGERQRHGGSETEEVEPLYGNSYLPRKFKTAIALPGDNCIDVYSHDLGLLAVCEDFHIIGYNVLVGGGFGVTPSAQKTFPALAKRMTFVRPEKVIDLATAIVKVQRDFGNRADRKIARLKYLIADWGLERFKAKVEETYGQPLGEPREEDVHGFEDHIGWYEQGDGRWFYGLNVENGRIKDEAGFRLKTALRTICSTYGFPMRLTAHQSILFCEIADADRAGLEKILKDHGVPLSEEVSTVRRWSMACPAMPTCGLAVTESERALPGMIDQLEVELSKLGLGQEAFTLRMTGCPNACARPYNSDIGLVGKTKGKYTIFLGGRTVGNRLNEIYQDLVPADEVVPRLTSVLAYFKAERHEGETLGDFCHRQGMQALRDHCENDASQGAV